MKNVENVERVGVIPGSCLCVSRFFFLRGGEERGSGRQTYDRTATSDYCLAQLIIIIIIIIILALYSYTFYTEMPLECGKLGSNYIKVPNSETYDTH